MRVVSLLPSATEIVGVLERMLTAPDRFVIVPIEDAREQWVAKDAMLRTLLASGAVALTAADLNTGAAVGWRDGELAGTEGLERSGRFCNLRRERLATHVQPDPYHHRANLAGLRVALHQHAAELAPPRQDVVGPLYADVVAARQQAGPRHGADGGGVEAGELAPLGRQPVDVRRADAGVADNFLPRFEHWEHQ